MTQTRRIARLHADRRARSRRSGQYALCIFLLGITCALGCSALGFYLGPIPQDDSNPASIDLGLAIVSPAAGALPATLGIETVIQWADVATLPGTVVRVHAQKQNNVLEDVGDPIHLVGDGTPGSGRDALADGDSDKFIWDITGVRVGDYVIIATIETPDGQTKTVRSRDVDRNLDNFVQVTTALPIPALAFTTLTGADETVTIGNDFAITWTDNGVANADALLLLGLDTDEDHDSGNEIVLLSNQPLSTDGNTGDFTFNGLDENTDPIAEGTYRVFARLDDNANDLVTIEAPAQLILQP